MINYKALSDNEVITLMKSGDHNAFATIFDRYWGPAYSHAIKMTKDEDEAKDIVQDVFLSIWQSSDFKLKSNFSALLFIAIRNRVLNSIRNNKVRADYLELFALYIESHDNNVIRGILEKETEQSISGAIALLPKKMREVFELSRKEQMSNREIAQRLDISEKTVKKQISNALSLIRISLGRLIMLFVSAISFIVR